ncbi:beta-ketoacyl synthase N-terminal-like domain-containing protein [Streptomyces sp. NPDC006678]|uniref:beta-ketoacyl-[acyl-carrier-protein] synthase family protein n=1 Tax=Streptomyces sp. NPDC006678 TaxID=3157185 RepID=UPI0033CF50EE
MATAVERTPGRAGIVVTGVGAVSPAGLGHRALWDAVRGGRVTTGAVTRFDTSRHPSHRAGEIPRSALSRLDSLVPPHRSLAARCLAAAAAEAAHGAGLTRTGGFTRTGGLTREGGASTEGGARTGVFAGTVMGTRPVLDHGITSAGLTAEGTDWAEPARLLDLVPEVVPVDGPVVLLASGCSVGGDAVACGAAAISEGEVDVAICGGAEELSQEVFAMFTTLRALAPDVARPFDDDRLGMQPAEGAAVVILESAEHCAARGGLPLAVLLAHGAAADAYHLTRPRPTGDALVEAIGTCLRDAGRAPEEIDWVCAHGTGTRASDGVEARAIVSALGGPGRRRPAVSSLKGMLGHTQGAAGVLEAVVAVLAMAAGHLPGNATLRRPDPACAGLDLVPPRGREAPVATVLSLAFGLGGGVSALLLGAAGGDDEA